MTVASATARSGPYAGNGSTTVFAYTFRVLDEAHLRVVLTDSAGNETVQTLATHYGVSGVGDSGGGSVTMVTAPATGETLTVLRDVPFTQETDYQNQGAYYAETVEDALDLLTMADQQLEERIDRSVTLPVASTITDLAFPTPTADALIGWNADANALANFLPNTSAYVAAELAALTGPEALQLQSIGDTTISAAQWGYLGGAGAAGGAVMAAATALAGRTALGMPVRTPEDYGAIGDGSTNDTTALQAWLDGIQGHAAIGWVPPGKTYRFNARLYVRTGTTIRAYGAVFKAVDSANIATGLYLSDSTILIGVTRVTIEGLTIDGNRTSRTLPGEGANFYVFSSEDVVFKDCRAINAAQDGFYVGGSISGDGLSRRVVLDACFTDAAYRNGVSVVGVAGLQIRAGAFINTAGAVAGPEAGIDVEPINADSQNAGVGIYDVVVTSNDGDGILVQVAESTGVVVQNIRADSNGGYGVRIDIPRTRARARDIFGSGNTSGLVGGIYGVDESGPAGLRKDLGNDSGNPGVNWVNSIQSSWLTVANATFVVPAHYASAIIDGQIEFSVEHSTNARTDFRLWDVTNGAVISDVKPTVHASFASVTLPFRFSSDGTTRTVRMEANLSTAATVTVRYVYYRYRVTEA